MVFETAFGKVFGTKHDRAVKKMRPLIAAINNLEPQMKALGDAELAAHATHVHLHNALESILGALDASTGSTTGLAVL